MGSMSTEGDVLLEIARRRWEFYGASAKPLYVTIYPPLYTVGFHDRYGKCLDLLYTSESDRAHFFMDSEQLMRLAESVVPTLLAGPWEWYDQYIRELRDFQVFNGPFLEARLEEMNDASVFSLMKEYRERFTPPFITNNIIEPVSYYFQRCLKDMLVEEGVGAERASELVDQYGQAVLPNYVKLCAKEYRDAASHEDRERVRRKYYYMHTDYLGPKEVTHEQLRSLADTTPLSVAEKTTIEGLSEKAQALLNTFQMVATMQDVRKAELLEMVTAAYRFGIEAARRKGVSPEDIEYATWDEIESGAWNAADLPARRSAFAMYRSLETEAVFQGDAARRVIAATNAHILHVDGGGEVKGVCASKGKTQGRVVVVLSPSEFEKVRSGDILFTMMTRPEYLPVMHKAAAFVCDEGGLTSHAAIVAREMKKPCIVGTKVGTRVFKDGDTVEVDAERGVVRKMTP